MPSALSIDASVLILSLLFIAKFPGIFLQFFINIFSAPPKSKPKSNYKEFSRNLNTGESPQTGYTKLDSYFPPVVYSMVVLFFANNIIISKLATLSLINTRIRYLNL
uniref:Wsv460 n=1 Tax=Heterorhabditis bacteriophora TaxID=37862 RepID=A0A1I7WWT8_HETBA